jgi:hypothetical protein
MNKLKIVAPLIFATLATGCSTIPEAGTQEHKVYVQEQRMEHAEQAIDRAPEWFTKPKCSPTSICATATASSLDMQLAIDKATLDAKYSLADKIKGRVSAKMTSFIAQTGSTEQPEIHAETTKVIKNVITNIATTGYEISKQAILPSKQGYRAFVLAEYPIGSANKQLVAETKKNEILTSRARASMAFTDLEAEIKASR